MGYKTEINYILKASTETETFQIENNSLVTITKSGFRTFILGSLIMIANHKWEIIGMCIIREAQATNRQALKVSEFFIKEFEADFK